MARAPRPRARIALVAADRHRARVASSGRYHAWPSRTPSVRSAPRQPDQRAPTLVPPGRMTPTIVWPGTPSWR